MNIINMYIKLLTWHVLRWYSYVTEQIITAPVLFFKMLMTYTTVLEDMVIAETQNVTTNRVDPCIKSISVLSRIWKLM